MYRLVKPNNFETLSLLTEETMIGSECEEKLQKYNGQQEDGERIEAMQGKSLTHIF